MPIHGSDPAHFAGSVARRQALVLAIMSGVLVTRPPIESADIGRVLCAPSAGGMGALGRRFRMSLVLTTSLSHSVIADPTTTGRRHDAKRAINVGDH